MKAVVQRCFSASVKVKDKVVGNIKKGFVVFLAIGKNDSEKDLNYLTRKICGLRIFKNSTGKMSLSPNEVSSEILVISNFTLYGDTRHGFRPDFTSSMPPKIAKDYVSRFTYMLRSSGVFNKVEEGIFGEDMNVIVSNDGPVTIIFDTEGAKWKEKKD